MSFLKMGDLPCFEKNTLNLKPICDQETEIQCYKLRHFVLDANAYFILPSSVIAEIFEIIIVLVLLHWIFCIKKIVEFKHKIKRNGYNMVNQSCSIRRHCPPINLSFCFLNIYFKNSTCIVRRWKWRNT